MSLSVNQLIGFGAKRAAASGFAGGNVSYSSIKVMCEDMVTGAATAPTAGGTLTINSQSLGSYDYTIKSGAQTISSFLNSDWFTTTADSRAAFIVVNGNLTINSGQTLIPSNRKLFTVIYVVGNLAVSGSISMTARGADHSAATGSNVTAAAIRIAAGTYSGVTNPEVPAAGGAGGTTPGGTGDGNTGTAGSAGGTGGGGSGSLGTSGTSAGAAGTSFSGGPGGGGVNGGGSASASTNGGRGGNGSTGSNGASTQCSGGAGNPGGSFQTGGTAGSDGTGGVLIIICTGALSGAGSIVANGSNGGTGAANDNGAGSGGGSVTVMYGSDSSSISPTASGGSGGTGGGRSGGAGGAGTARKLAL
jgi:hypothetical protein